MQKKVGEGRDKKLERVDRVWHRNRLNCEMRTATYSSYNMRPMRQLFTVSALSSRLE